MFSSRPLIHEIETIRKCRSQINCVTPAILLRELFSSPRLDRDKNVTRIWKQVSGKFWSQNKEWRNYAQIRAETTARCSKIRDLRQTRNKRSHKSYLKHKLEILRSNKNIFLDSFRQSVIPCRKKAHLGSVLARVHEHRSYYWRRGWILFALHFLVYLVQK